MNNILHTLANQIRIRILLCLADEPKSVQELINNCGLAQSAVSQHLVKLKRAGLVTSRRDGKFVYYRLTFPEAAILSLEIEEFIRKVSK